MSLDPAFTAQDHPGIAPPLAVSERPRLEYFRAYQAALASRNWPLNLFWGTLAFLSSAIVPLVGWLAWTGYTYDCVEHLNLTRGKELPDFDPNRFGDYLTRGIFPFLVQIVIWCSLGACYVLTYVGIFALAAVIAGIGEEHAEIVLGVGLPLMGLALAALVMTPIFLLAPL